MPTSNPEPCLGRLAGDRLTVSRLRGRSRPVFVQAFHTFPDDCAIVKSQSLFQLP